MLSAIAARKARQQNLKNSTKRRQSHHTRARKKSRSENKHDSGTALSDDDSGMSIDLHQEDVASPQPAQPVQRKAWSPSRLVFDSSDDASDANETPLSEPPRFPSSNNHLTNEEPELLSTYRPAADQNMFRLSEDEGLSVGLTGPAVALVLFPSATVSFVGTYRLRVLRGSIFLLGTIVRPSQVVHQVFAPYSSPIPVIQALAARGESSKSPSDIPARILSSVDEGDVVIVLQELQSGVDGLGRIVRTFEGVFDDVHPKGIPVIPLRGAYFTTQAVRGLRAFRLSPSWEAALSGSPFSSSSETNSKPLVLLVKGQKNSGKSTLARILVNRLISRYRRVAFLECDIGQSEFTPGGMVALNIVERPIFGPPFTHPTLPHQAHYVGADNPRSSPSHYLRAIQALVDTYRLDLQYATSFVGVEDDSDDDRIVDIIPLVVNTMGWTKGLGIDLARRIGEMVQPTDIFTFDTTPPDGDGVEPHGPRVHTLEPAMPSPRFTAADHRALSLLSYFHAVFPDPTRLAPLQQATASLWDASLPLCAQPPYELTSHLALDRIVLTGAGAEDVVRPELVRVLAGALVALVSDAAPSRSDSEELYTPGTPPPDPASSSCLGLALVRGVSSDGSKLQLLTPVPPEALVNARVLVMGELRLPVWGWLDFRSADGEQTGADDVPFLSWGRSAGAGGERRRVRRNIMRRAQM
ncbi:hypothetical protein EDB92DRAFT_2060227 [Lactarius akahatsu]|uniref:Polynucleotide 5'-hydroxyl-kinase GRC3 n=1 Tax=Lactarius akahatsu TaxID=416441 RepID=A0AAD4LUA5_9AGAM|nr:hypothetical protein EDB92DRAFT_2060227 [Lactarius akahatsu]